MKYFDPEQGAQLRAAFEEIVLDWPGVTATTMFGCPSYQAKATLFAVLVTEAVALTRLPADDRTQLEQLFGTAPFDAGGRTVEKWVTVPVESDSTLTALRPYLEASYEAALNDAET